MSVRDRQLRLIEMLGSRIDQEHVLISSRMTWLMTLNGFLFAAFGLLVTNASDFQSATPLATLIAAIALLGALSNASALFSHYWASRAIREADLATRWALERVDDDRLGLPEGLFRLAGRDPKLEPKDGGPPKSSRTHPFWPIQRLLHPWNLLPLLGCATFAVLPFGADTVLLADGRPYRAFNGLSAVPALGLVLTLVVIRVAGPLERLSSRRSSRRRIGP